MCRNYNAHAESILNFTTCLRHVSPQSLPSLPRTIRLFQNWLNHQYLESTPFKIFLLRVYNTVPLVRANVAHHSGTLSTGWCHRKKGGSLINRLIVITTSTQVSTS
jgi:hypothetical protein